MYYHEISFLPQLRFLVYSLMSGFADGIICSLLCSKAIKGKIKYAADFLFCIITVFIIVSVNIASQEGALRVYEVFGFSAGLLIFIAVFKKRTDKIFVFISDALKKILFNPICKFFKEIINKARLILKKQGVKVYNLKVETVKKLREKKSLHDKARKEKKKKSKTDA